MGTPVPEVAALVADISYSSKQTDPIIFTTYFKERARAQLRSLLKLLDDTIIIKDQFLCLQRARTTEQGNQLSAATQQSLSEEPLRDCTHRMRDNQRCWIAAVCWLASEWNNDQAHRALTGGMVYVFFAYALLSALHGNLYFQPVLCR